jgi:carbonic anhydrase/acetyltransferase-like protein (isoleucine patch superfamily)
MKHDKWRGPEQNQFNMFVDLQSHREKIDPSAFIAPSAVVVGDVTIGAQASLWFGAVVRGDVQAIVIGPRTSVQDNCVLHVDAGFPCYLGAGITLGHGAIVHGATVEDNVLIGIRATVLNGARIGEGSIIAAGALVPPGMVVPPGSMVMGLPGTVVRAVSDAERAMILENAAHYCEYARRYLGVYGVSKNPGS